MKTIAIGDIHGMYDKLIELYSIVLEKGFIPEKDKLVFLGDYVDGGPDVKKVITQLMEWEKKYPHWVFLKGNHESMMLDALIGKNKKYGDFYLWFNQGGRATTNSYKDDIPYENGLSDYEKALLKPEDIIPMEHLNWLIHRPLYHEEEHYFFVHAGVPHAIKLENLKKKLEEGDFAYEEKVLWIRDEFINDHHDYGKKIIYGHTPVQQPDVREFKIGIDTMTRYGGCLTALFLPKEEFFQTTSTEGQWW